MDTSKIIIGILIIGGLIIKEIFKDAKSKNKSSTSRPPVFANRTSEPNNTPKPPIPQTERSSIPQSSGLRPEINMVKHTEINEPSPIEEPQKVISNETEELERWRRAMIDSEIFKTKF